MVIVKQLAPNKVLHAFYKPSQTHFVLLGIVHNKFASCAACHELISRIKPDNVVLELCQERMNFIRDYQIQTNEFYWAYQAVKRTRKSAPCELVLGDYRENELIRLCEELLDNTFHDRTLTKWKPKLFKTKLKTFRRTYDPSMKKHAVSEKDYRKDALPEGQQFRIMREFYNQPQYTDKDHSFSLANYQISQGYDGDIRDPSPRFNPFIEAYAFMKFSDRFLSLLSTNAFISPPEASKVEDNPKHKSKWRPNGKSRRSRSQNREFVSDKKFRQRFEQWFKDDVLLYDVLVDQRNTNLYSNIFHKAKGKKVVAVIGRDHIPGLISLLEHNENFELELHQDWF
mmetsp:Transcript_49375/g.56707  ORF Transcript_49375/g.56707 Transcript_49375/m.56707 type:complete len:341 (-) Transcript_49375:93-1115(-)